jgi:PAS domain S-box-containing protein
MSTDRPLESFLHSLPTPLCLATKPGIITFANAELERSLQRDDLVGTNVRSLFPPEEWEQLQASVASLEKTAFCSIPINLLRKDGSRFPVTAKIEKYGFPMLAAEAAGDTPAEEMLAFTFVEISLSLTLHNVARELDASTIPALEKHENAAYIKDPYGVFLFVNDAMARLVGRKSGKEMIGLRDEDFFPSKFATRFRQDDRRVLAMLEPIFTVECLERNIHPQPRWVQVCKFPFREDPDRGSRITGVCVVFWDAASRQEPVRCLYELLAEAAFRRKQPQVRIERSIEFDPEYWQSGMSLLAYFGEIVRRRFPDEKVRVKIEQDGLKVRLIIETDGGLRDSLEETLRGYCEVIVGERTPEQFLQDPHEILRLKNKLVLANAEIEMNQNINQALQTRVAQTEKMLADRNSALAELFLEERSRRSTAGGLVVWFAVLLDIVGSSAVKGGEKRRLYDAVHSLANAFGKRFGGQCVNTFGDAVVVCFENGGQALGYARGMNAASGQEGIRLRVGVHVGPMETFRNAAIDRKDVCGPGVELAARLEQMARTGEILVSESVYAHPHAEPFRGEMKPVVRRLKKPAAGLAKGAKIDCYRWSGKGPPSSAGLAG